MNKEHIIDKFSFTKECSAVQKDNWNAGHFRPSENLKVQIPGGIPKRDTSAVHRSKKKQLVWERGHTPYKWEISFGPLTSGPPQTLDLALYYRRVQKHALTKNFWGQGNGGVQTCLKFLRVWPQKIFFLGDGDPDSWQVTPATDLK